MALRRPLGVVAGISPCNGAHVLAWRTVVNPLDFPEIQWITTREGIGHFPI